jgi:hypothetical protein
MNYRVYIKENKLKTVYDIDKMKDVWKAGIWIKVNKGYFFVILILLALIWKSVYSVINGII